jgi:hypothetical protein
MQLWGRKMLSDSLDELVRRLIGTSAPNAHAIRLKPVEAAVAQEACRRGGHSLADMDVVRALEGAGLDLDRRVDQGQPSLIWARLDRAETAEENPADTSATRGELPSPQLTFYRVEDAEVHQTGTSAQWLVESFCWRRGPDGSLAVYELSTRVPFQRAYESEVETIDYATAAEVAGSMVKQVVIELMPLLVDAVRATQGKDPDLRPERDRLS